MPNSRDWTQKFNKTSQEARRYFLLDNRRRFTFRFFQCVFAVIMWGLLGSQDSDLWTLFDINNLKITMWVFFVMVPFWAVVTVVLQMEIGFFLWRPIQNSRTKLLIEMGIDVLNMFIQIMFFCMMLGKANGRCPAGRSPQCDKFNWLVAFLVFSSISWILSLVFDVQELRHGGQEEETSMSELRLSLKQSSQTRV